MNPVLERYLADLDRALARLNHSDRQDALREIESHFADATEAGAAPDEIVARLGSPRLLAAALVAGTGNGDTEPVLVRVRRVLVASVFIAGTSVTSVLVVPFLAVVAVGFALIAALSPVAGLLRTLGATWIQINVGPDRPLPAEWSLPFMIGLALVSALVAWLAYRGIRLYLRIVARGYRAVMATGSNA